ADLLPRRARFPQTVRGPHLAANRPPSRRSGRGARPDRRLEGERALRRAPARAGAGAAPRRRAAASGPRGRPRDLRAHRGHRGLPPLTARHAVRLRALELAIRAAEPRPSERPPRAAAGAERRLPLPTRVPVAALDTAVEPAPQPRGLVPGRAARP